MLIQGPLTIGVLPNAQRQGYELHLSFTQDFRRMNLSDQGRVLGEYLAQLNETIPHLAEDDRNRAGMLIVQQLVEQLLPHVESGELALEDSIVVEIGPDNPFTNLVSLMRQ